MNLPEVGNGGVSGFPAVSVGNKRNKYQRMDSDAEGNRHDDGDTRSNRTRKYVMACAFFASLNNVLLGYGELPKTKHKSFNNCWLLPLVLENLVLSFGIVIHVQMLG